ncbi:MAG TPA: ABC transporter substrate-binding protein [Cyclobacteriaceae bacterium]
MKHLSKYIILISIAFACSSRQNNNAENQTASSIKYAQGFSIKQEGKIKHVTVSNPYQGATEGFDYLLVPKGENIPVHDDKTQVVMIPIENMVCTSTTHIPFLDYLNQSDRLIGFPTTDYISSEKMRKRVDEGKITDLGIDKGMNLEVLFALKPSMVMGYAMTKDLGQLKKINELGIPVVINAEYLEKHPLGRAEWIKFMALFLNKEKEADSIFAFIEEEYLKTQKLALQSETQPTILSGVVYGDAWFMPGGGNYAARLLKDASSNYLWASDSTTGFLELSFESVFNKAKDADFWIGVGSFNSLDEIRASDERYTKFKPFTTGNVYTYNARLGAKGGSEFLELGYLRPDIILKDLTKITHPEKLPDYELYFHKRLE